MKALQKYVTDYNFFAVMFEKAEPIRFPLSRQDCELLQDSLECDLSPENISCDGEASVAHVRRQRAFLTEVQKELQACMSAL